MNKKAYFRFYWKQLGDHTHVRLFAEHGGKVGDLVFRNEEWQRFVTLLDASRHVPTSPSFSIQEDE